MARTSWWRRNMPCSIALGVCSYRARRSRRWASTDGSGWCSRRTTFRSGRTTEAPTTSRTTELPTTSRTTELPTTSRTAASDRRDQPAGPQPALRPARAKTRGADGRGDQPRPRLHDRRRAGAGDRPRQPAGPARPAGRGPRSVGEWQDDAALADRWARPSDGRSGRYRRRADLGARRGPAGRVSAPPDRLRVSDDGPAAD